MKVLWVIGVLVLASGCASHEVRCHGRLEPINAPNEGAPPQTRGDEPVGCGS